MRCVKTIRKIHLWFGLILAVFLLTEAVTGLILAEPWTIGAGKPEKLIDGDRRLDIEQSEPAGQREIMPPPGENGIAERTDSAQSGFNALSFVKMLHQGNVGGLDFGWVLDLTAIGLVILALTGIYISIPLLRPRSRRN